MCRVRLLTTFVSLSLLAVVVGCARGARPLAELPAHDLDLSAARPAARTLPQPRPMYRPGDQGEGEGAWAVRNPRQWRYIVVHHSATDDGNAETFDAYHRRRGWEGLGYHFVIDNGRGGPDGRIEVGPRWRAQKCGAHTGGTPGNEYNEYGIGICLVGDFTKTGPSSAQLSSLRRLVSYLASEYHIPPERIIGHCDAPNATTRCPGTALHGYISGTLREYVRSRYALGSPTR